MLFYCHFPDLLLTKRQSFLKKLYRTPIDWLEEKTTGMADCIVVNSNFTGVIWVTMRCTVLYFCVAQSVLLPMKKKSGPRSRCSREKGLQPLCFIGLHNSPSSHDWYWPCCIKAVFDHKSEKSNISPKCRILIFFFWSIVNIAITFPNHVNDL